MIFINCGGSRFRLGATIALLALLLSAGGCQTTPEMEPGQDALTADGAEATPVIERLPDPYLADRPSVSGAAKRRFQDALDALAAQQWDVAETDLLWLTQNYPTLSGPYLNLALLYQRSGQPGKVEAAYQQAISANPSNVAAYNQLGIYLRGEGRFSEAEQIYQQALVVWPDSAESHLNLGILYDLYMGDLDRALAQYQAYQALQDEPDRQVQGWIVDTERRLADRQGDEQAAASGGE